MRRLHEHEGKAMLREAGILTPRGEAVGEPADAARVARNLGTPVAVKMQTMIRDRRAISGVAFADTPADAAAHVERMLAMSVGAAPVERVLVEERLAVARQLAIVLSHDIEAGEQTLLLSAAAGDDVDKRPGRIAIVSCDAIEGPDMQSVRNWLAAAQIDPDSCAALEQAIANLADVARGGSACFVEISPLAILEDGRVAALNCRMSIDDGSNGSHAVHVAQLNADPEPESWGLVGLHVAGSPDAMASVDALVAGGGTLASLCRTGAGTDAADAYRAVGTILSQPGLVGSVVVSDAQAQRSIACGVAKACWELSLAIPALVHFAGGTDDEAVEILDAASRDVPGIIEACRADDTPTSIASRLADLVARFRSAGAPPWSPHRARVPDYVGAGVRFEIDGGVVWIDPAIDAKGSRLVIEHSKGAFKDEHGRPAPALDEGVFRSRTSDLIVCEVACRRAGSPALFVDLEVDGLGL